MIRFTLKVPTVLVILSILPSPTLQIFGYFGDETPDILFGRCNRNSRDVAACIHKYLEKNFIGLSPIVYPKDQSSESQCVSSEVYERKHQILMDGPTLQNSCNDLSNVLDCMFEQLEYCGSMDTFFHLRHLHYSLKKVSHWLCGSPAKEGEVESDQNQHISVRSRFLGLLESIKCIECVRIHHQKCMSTNPKSAVDDVSLWHNVLRLDVGLERCDEIKEKMKCLQRDEILPRICGKKATEIHKNLTELFVTTWCDTAPFTVSNSTNNVKSIPLSLTLSCFIFYWMSIDTFNSHFLDLN